MSLCTKSRSYERSHVNLKYSNSGPLLPPDNTDLSQWSALPKHAMESQEGSHLCLEQSSHATLPLTSLNCPLGSYGAWSDTAVSMQRRPHLFKWELKETHLNNTETRLTKSSPSQPNMCPSPTPNQAGARSIQTLMIKDSLLLH